MASKHYLQVTDEHFKSAQNPTQQPIVKSRTPIQNPNIPTDENVVCESKLKNANNYELETMEVSGLQGLEP